MDVKWRWNPTLDLLQWAYRFREFTHKWLKNPKYSNCHPVLTSPDELTMVMYLKAVSRPVRYWTLWMWTRHTVSLHHVITVYNDMFDRMDGIMQALAMKKTQWMEDLYFAMKFAWHTLSKSNADVTPMTSMLLISADILDSFQKLRSFRKWGKAMHEYPEDETSYPTQYQEAFLKYMENEYCSIHSRISIIALENVPGSNPLPSGMAPGFGQSCFDPYDLSSNDEKYWTSKGEAGMTPGQSDLAACLQTAAMLYLNSPPEAPVTCTQDVRNLNDYSSDPTNNSSTLSLPNSPDWSRQKQVTHWKYADPSNVACNIISIIPHGVRVEMSSSLGRDEIGGRQSQTHWQDDSGKYLTKEAGSGE